MEHHPFITGIAVGVAACGSALLLHRALYQDYPGRGHSTAASMPLASTAGSAAEDDELLSEQLSRNVQFFGADAQKKLEDSFVIVVGLGGVGSHAAHLLVRAGVKRIRLVDFDQVTLSSLNRHAVASRADVGTPKATTLARHLRAFAPYCEIDARATMFTAAVADDLLAGNPDYVIDAIDDVNTKVELLAHCLREELRVLSSMGAGAKSDPTRVHIASLSDVSNDPLAAKMRWRLKKVAGNGAEGRIEVVYSSEKPHMKLLPLTDEQKDRPEDFGAVDNFRVRIMPVLGTMPALFGMTMAARVATNLAGRPFEPQPCPGMSHSVLHKMSQWLANRERKWYNSNEGVPFVGEDDMGYLICDVWRRKCAVTGTKMGASKRVELCRFRYDRAATPTNMVLLQSKYADQLCTLGERGKLPFDAEEGELDIAPERLRWIEAKLQSLGNWEV